MGHRTFAQQKMGHERKRLGTTELDCLLSEFLHNCEDSWPIIQGSVFVVARTSSLFLSR